jgi:hypothetical protein
VRILIRTSKWAIWARRLASLVLPLVVITLALHWQRLIPSDVFLVAAGVVGAIAVATLLASLVALGRLWHTGDQGWGRALVGLFVSLLCLAPYGWYGALALQYPPVTDMATTERGQLPLLFQPGMEAMPRPRVLDAARQKAVFPNVAPRTYPLAPPQTFALVTRLVDDRGWTIELSREPAEASPGRINAQATTLMGWREEIVLRVMADPEGSRVDMRSASLNALHDFGSNGSRIEEFLVALDTEVTTLLRDNPLVAAPLDAEDEPTAVPLPRPAP